MVDLDEWFERQTKKIKQEIALRMEQKAIHKVPVKTGNLKLSIQSGVDGDTIWVGAGFHKDVDYAKYVEYGTSTQRGQPFLRPALFETKAEIPKIIAKRLSN